MAKTFNTLAGQTIDRELLVAYLNTGTAASPTWSPLGKRVESSEMSYDYKTDTKQDILGATRTTLKKPVITQDFSPCSLDAGDTAIIKLHEYVRTHNVSALAAQDVLVVHLYYSETVTVGETTTVEYFAERYPESAIEITGLGGDGGGNIDMPIKVTYGGERTTGSAVKGVGGLITYTAE